MHPFDRITIDPQLMQGKPCVRGMRITVALVVNLVAAGMTKEEIIRSYPYLEPEDIAQCLSYASCAVNEEIMPFDETADAVSG
ncbi:MAG TPA: DUF433 domain-containing protein [Phycisphaerae bacterium]|nr:DUF433 domain-containing protein [Phycisphaerae bacterium]